MTYDWEHVREVVARALELAPESRRAFVLDQCGENAALTAQILDMIQAAEVAGDDDFLEPPEQIAGPSFDPDTDFDDFEIVREIGRGGMGVVYLAKQTSLNRPVALKVFVEGILTTDQVIEAFHREAKKNALLSGHPGIVTVYASGTEGTTHWYSMEYIAGHDLGKEIVRMRGGDESVAGEARPFLSLPGRTDHAQTVARVGFQVAQALQHAHDRGVVHRDIKPQTLLLRPDGSVLMADFGIARDEQYGSLTRTGEVKGTPHYMSPEQAKVSDVKIDHRTDVYSLGVVLYELATLQRPHEGPTHAALLEQLRECEPKLIRRLDPRLPRDLEVICDKALRKNPDERYSSAGEFALDLERFLNGEPIHARRQSLAQRAALLLKRSGGRYVSAALLLLVASVTWSLTSAAASRKTMAALSVMGVPKGQQVGVEWIDPLLGGVVERTWYGQGGFENRRIKPGFVRVTIGQPGSPCRQFTRLLVGGEATSITPGKGPDGGGLDGPDLGGMVQLSGGVTHTRDNNPGALNLPLNFTPTTVEDFYIDATEVSNAQYRLYIEATGAQSPAHWGELDWSKDAELPVVGVTWFEARSYAEWLGKRLPSFPEWVWAARGAENRLYPWPDPKEGELRGNVAKAPQGYPTTVAEYKASAVPVTSHPDARTSTGIWHLFGNVCELTESVAAQPVEDPTSLTLQSRNFKPMLSAGRIVAGHSWSATSTENDGKDLTTADLQIGLERARVSLTTGFRCAVGVLPHKGP